MAGNEKEIISSEKTPKYETKSDSVEFLKQNKKAIVQTVLWSKQKQGREVEWRAGGIKHKDVLLL